MAITWLRFHAWSPLSPAPGWSRWHRPQGAIGQTPELTSGSVLVAAQTAALSRRSVVDQLPSMGRTAYNFPQSFCCGQQPSDNGSRATSLQTVASGSGSSAWAR